MCVYIYIIAIIINLLAPSASPLNLLESKLSSRSFYLEWEPPLFEDINGILRKYIINITDENRGTSFTLESYNTSAELYGLLPHTTYFVSVSAFTVDEGPHSPVIVIKTLEESESWYRLMYTGC